MTPERHGPSTGVVGCTSGRLRHQRLALVRLRSKCLWVGLGRSATRHWANHGTALLRLLTNDGLRRTVAVTMPAVHVVAWCHRGRSSSARLDVVLRHRTDVRQALPWGRRWIAAKRTQLRFEACRRSRDHDPPWRVQRTVRTLKVSDLHGQRARVLHASDERNQLCHSNAVCTETVYRALCHLP